MTEIGENISVIATFAMPYKMRPIRFRWSGRLFEVKEITYQWITKEGIKTIYHYSVTDGNSLYEIAFDSHSLLWRLERLEAEK